MIRSRRPAPSAPFRPEATRSNPVLVSQNDVIAVQNFARELQIFAGKLGDARANNLRALLEPVFESVPHTATPLSAWIVRALLINVLHRIDAHFGRPPSSTGMDLLWRADSRRMMREVLQEHVDELNASHSTSMPAPRNSCGDSRIDRALDYMRQHFNRSSLAVDEVCAFVRLSRWHFSRLFTRRLGMTFRDVVRDLRMEQATILLTEQFLSIKEVAARLGFGHSTEFNRQFKQSFKMTPTEWRAHHASVTGPHLQRRTAH